MISEALIRNINRGWREGTQGTRQTTSVVGLVYWNNNNSKKVALTNIVGKWAHLGDYVGSVVGPFEVETLEN